MKEVIRPTEESWLYSRFWPQFVITLTPLFALRFFPIPYWWGIIYGEYRVDLWWPVLFFIVCGTLVFWGHFCHRRTGEPQFRPFAIVLQAVLALLFFIVMVLLTAAHWTLAWALPALVVIFLAGLPLGAALLGYSELWRETFRTDLSDKAAVLIEENDIEALVSREVRRGKWGSLHGMLLIGNHYNKSKRSFRSHRADKGASTVSLRQAMTAGSALFTYIESPWAPSVLEGREARLLKRELARELLIMCLSKEIRQQLVDAGKADLLERLGRKVDRWWEELGHADEAYYQFLGNCVALGAYPRPGDEYLVREILDIMDGLYRRAVDKGDEGTGIPKKNLRMTMQNTWLAIAHRGLPAQAVFDFWMDIRIRDREGPMPASQDDAFMAYDIAFDEARKFLARHYANAAAITSAGWEKGFEARRAWNATE